MSDFIEDNESQELLIYPEPMEYIKNLIRTKYNQSTMKEPHIEECFDEVQTRINDDYFDKNVMGANALNASALNTKSMDTDSISVVDVIRQQQFTLMCLSIVLTNWYC